MRRQLLRNRKKNSAAKLITGILLGGLVGATVRWLTVRSSRMSVRERIKTSEGNIESQARELAEDVRNQQKTF
jgi:gas vesicle protein